GSWGAGDGVVKVLLSWLQEFAPDIEGDPVELGETLSGLGLAVEDMTITGEGLDGIVVARVMDLRAHPDADKIQLVDVDIGDGEALQVCCGAFNMSVGDLIPFATVGTVMPNGMEIAQRKMRGQLSNGMCCSAAEMGLGEDDEGIMLLGDTLDGDHVGMVLTEALGMERDVLWDLEVNANRPDAMSVAGVARDLAAGLGVEFVPLAFDPLVDDGALASEASVDIVAPDLCGRFLARVLRNVHIGTSPQWIRHRITALGMRPINTVVDISNYVMLELGQPNHTYDLATVPEGHLRVRRAHQGEQLVTLDGIERALIPQDGVIADKTDVPIGLAGVMGGLATEISDQTTDVLLEMAWWDPPSISRTVKRLNLPSEASVRYRRGADWGINMDRAMYRFVQLMGEAGATASDGTIDERGTLPDDAPINVRPAKVNGLLGTNLHGEEMADHLVSIGFEVSSEAGELAVSVPTWRWDTTTETDVAEEVARLHGFENIARTVPKGHDAGALTEYQQNRRTVRDILMGLGCDETFPMPFLAPGDLAKAGLNEDAVTLSNPLIHEESVLRTSLLPGQLKAIAYNQSHRVGELRLFEVGHIFRPPQGGELLPDEREHLAVAITGHDALEASRVLMTLGNAVALPNLQMRATAAAGMHPTRSAEVMVAGQARGLIGEVDPLVLEAYGVEGRVAWIELDLGAILDGPIGNRKYRPVSKYPSSDIDLAFEVPIEIPAASIAASLRKGGGKLLTDLELFDVYRGQGLAEGSRSLAYRLRFQANDHTLTDDEVAELRESCISTVTTQQAGTTLRG
ncbi:MAG: phenylalanine--tRNA ligase subunit beta, partial [Acidimicrobiales bacterium]